MVKWERLGIFFIVLPNLSSLGQVNAISGKGVFPRGIYIPRPWNTSWPKTAERRMERPSQKKEYFSRGLNGVGRRKPVVPKLCPWLPEIPRNAPIHTDITKKKKTPDNRWFTRIIRGLGDGLFCLGCALRSQRSRVQIASDSRRRH